MTNLEAANIRIKKGSILVYRIFDVAEEIHMPKVDAILRDSRGPDRFKVPKFIDRALVMKSPPMTFGLGEETLILQKRSLKADVLVKVRDFGVLSLIYQIPIEPGTAWSDLIQLGAELEEGSEIDTMAEQQCREVVSSISAAIKKPTNSSSFEDYIIYFLEEFADEILIKDLPSKVDVASLLLAENKVKISEGTRKNITEQFFQYGENDLTMIEWNSALVVEPSGGREVPDILEFSVTHLMEMRYYDELLSNKLNVLYDDIEKRRSSLFSSRFDRTYEEASTRYIEFSEFIERVENSLKVVGDFYLATLYRAATRRFRLTDWQENVTRKMNLLAQVSNLLQGELNVRRSHWLEVIVILLITWEIIIGFFGRL